MGLALFTLIIVLVIICINAIVFDKTADKKDSKPQKGVKDGED